MNIELKREVVMTLTLSEANELQNELVLLIEKADQYNSVLNLTSIQQFRTLLREVSKSS